MYLPVNHFRNNPDQRITFVLPVPTIIIVQPPSQHDTGRFQHAIVSAKNATITKIVWLKSARQGPVPETIFVTAAIQTEKFSHSQSSHKVSAQLATFIQRGPGSNFHLNLQIQYNFS